jgi:hypothetical protein
LESVSHAEWIMRKIIGLFALALLLAGLPMVTHAAGGSTSGGSSAGAGGNRAPIINGRRASSKHGHHFRHKNRSNEPADDNHAPIPDAARDHGNHDNHDGHEKHDKHDGGDGKGGKGNKDGGNTGTP